MQSRHGSLESAVLGALWNLENNGEYKNSVKEVYNALAQNDSDKRAYTTIKTVMDRLYEKKVLLRYREGKKFYYRTLYSNCETISSILQQTANRYCDGSLIKLRETLNSMIEENCLIGV